MYYFNMLFVTFGGGLSAVHDLCIFLFFSLSFSHTLSRSVTHTFFSIESLNSLKTVGRRVYSWSISIYIYFPFSLYFFLNSLRRTRTFSHSVLCHFLFFSVIVHLQDSHYIPYRSVNSTQNFDTPYLACSRIRERQRQKRDTIRQWNAARNSCSLLTTQIMQTFKMHLKDLLNL